MRLTNVFMDHLMFQEAEQTLQAAATLSAVSAIALDIENLKVPAPGMIFMRVAFSQNLYHYDHVLSFV